MSDEKPTQADVPAEALTPMTSEDVAATLGQVNHRLDEMTSQAARDLDRMMELVLERDRVHHALRSLLEAMERRPLDAAPFAGEIAAARLVLNAETT